MGLAGMVAVVTGAASGIGRASAVRLAEDGADVAVLDVDEAGLAETASRIEATGRRAAPVRVDLLDRADIIAAFDAVKRDLGHITILHNNAGGSLRGDIRTFRRSGPDQWDYMTTLNLRQAVDCTRQVVNEMVDAGYGRIINTSSEMAFRTGVAMTDYSAAKAGLLGFTRSLANEVGRYGVTVNAVCPGATRTTLTANLGDDRLRQTVSEIPLGRLGEPEEIAHAVSFFASPGASYVTGEHLLVTGGRTVH
ncbi:MAG: SDR family NAD(P)-dependent oxidoreductase [Actinomycetota bacterium]